MNEIMKLSDINTGYKGSPESWYNFISCWNKEAHDKFIKEENELPKHMRTKRSSLGIKLPQITDNVKKINKIDKRIGKKLPKSFTDFLSGTDSNTGYVLLIENYIPFFKAEKIDLFKNTDSMFFSIWYDNSNDFSMAEDEKYYIYNLTKQNPVHMTRFKYLDQVIQVGTIGGQAALLLNPCEKTKDGEWEAWLLSGQLPGVERYKSFAHMMYYNYFRQIYGSTYFTPKQLKQLKNTCADLITIELP